MKNITRIALAALLLSASAFAQVNTILGTSLAAAMTASATTLRVAVATGINGESVSQAGSALYIVDVGQTQGELVQVISISSTTATVRRAQKASAHASGAMVLVATNANWFYTTDPQGSCVTASTYVNLWLNNITGSRWKCSSQTLTWVPYFGNHQNDAQLLTATATASVAGATAIIGPLVEISGTEAITSFTMPVGWNGEGFCVLPTAAFTTVAGNNIAEATTADANQTLCYVWNARAAAFAASY